MRNGWPAQPVLQSRLFDLVASASSGGSQIKSKVPQKGLNYIEQQQIKRMYEITRHREAAAQTALMICCIC